MPVFRFTALIVAASLALSALAAGCGLREAGRWQEVRIQTDAEFEDVCFVDRSVGWMVGGSPFVSGGIIGRSIDGGRTWSYRSDLVPRKTGFMRYSLNAVHGFDRQRACVVGDGGEVLLTHDGGDNWRSVRHGRGIGDHLFGLHFIDDREGWAVGLGGVRHTTDGGETWTNPVADSSAGNGIGGRAIFFVDACNGWLAGQYAVVWRTRNGGETWARVPVIPTGENAGELPYLFGMTWVDASVGWIVGEFGTILHTIDGGDSWASQDPGSRELFLTAVQFVDDRTGWITGFLRSEGRSIVLHTVDAGATWSVERKLAGEELRALQIIDAETGWAVGDRARTQPQRMLRRTRRLLW